MLCLIRFACVWYTIGFREGRGGPGRRVRRKRDENKNANVF